MKAQPVAGLGNAGEGVGLGPFSAVGKIESELHSTPPGPPCWIRARECPNYISAEPGLPSPLNVRAISARV